jgi:acetyl/propionyl-CoA carboxylase alpha subunit
MFDINNKQTKFHESDSEWVKSFRVDSIKCLIVCRGPVRKETIDVFDAIGVREYGILLSEKDSVVYPMALAPELRDFKYINNIHRIQDYMGSGKEEKEKIMHQIILIAKENGYTHIFAGYGFMAEDADFIEAIEKSGVRFMGPASSVARQAGAKDAAKIIARKLNVSVTPGIDNITALTLLAKSGGVSGLEKISKDAGINFVIDKNLTDEENADKLLNLGYEKSKDLISIEDLQAEAEKQSEGIWKKFPTNRIRFKYIGGGGGKGQRVIKEKSEVKSAVIEILAESKVVSVGSNRNFLIELNIENTRHNEIQLIGNGEWCLALGGRDCSLQMHEQKLLEISNTRELLEQEIANSKDNPKRAKTIQNDLKVLTEMEEQSERFGAAVNLDSVSTFESIVEDTNHFFMEMNTRIQVEHRVTEMAYKLKFINPNNPADFFIVESLIEAMAILSVHGKKVPKPTRILRNISGAEVRINATNQSLQPHAGGLIQNWSVPSEFEIRDDQGIGIRNPDTKLFIHYRLAGAYDSNIALLVTYGDSRKETLERLSHIIKNTELRGADLQTNMPVHYGLINWILGHDIMFKPNTKFMLSYLAAIGSVATKLRDIDMDIAWSETAKKISKENMNLGKVFGKKLTLVLRPIKKLFENAHMLGGFLGLYNNQSWKIENGKVQFLKNPIDILSDLYDYLNLDKAEHKYPSDQIWDHDSLILDNATEFYKDYSSLTNLKTFAEIDKSFKENKNPNSIKIDAETFEKCKGSHIAFQLGLEILEVIPRLGELSGFFKIKMDEELNAIVPEEFSNTESVNKLIKALNPPPKAKSDEIIAPMGGMYYSKEAPNLPTMIKVGDQFKAGQPLFIIEVMKMFNKIAAPFSGTILKNFLEDSDGKIISKGQPIFKIQADELIVEESEEEMLSRKKKATLSLLA